MGGALALAMAGSARASAGRVLVFAAASLKDALDAVAAAWETRTGGSVTVSYAGSPTVARQIENGAPADLFFSANPGWMDHLAGEGLIDEGSRVDLLGNRLVLVAPAGREPSLALGPGADLRAALGDGRLAMADSDAVPAGIYGREALTSLGLWDDVSGRTAETQNVRAALALVARGEAPLGIVYRSDAIADPSVRLVDTFSEGSHPPIVYPVARLAASGNEAAGSFLDFLGDAEAHALFRTHGFTVLD